MKNLTSDKAVKEAIESGRPIGGSAGIGFTRTSRGVTLQTFGSLTDPIESASLAVRNEHSMVEDYFTGDIVPYGSNEMDAATQLTMLQSGAGPGPGLYICLQDHSGHAPTGVNTDAYWRQLVGFPLRCLSLKDSTGKLIIIDASVLPNNTTMEILNIPTCETIDGVLTDGYRPFLAGPFTAGAPPT